MRAEAEAGASGPYTWTDLLGVYDITVAVSGFKPITLKAVTVVANAVTNTSFNLQRGSVCEMVAVGEFGGGGLYPKSECQARA